MSPLERPLALVVVCALALAGCIAAPIDPADPDAGTTPRTGGQMTGTEERRDETGLCDGTSALATRGSFCATRTIEISGRISGFPLLDVEVMTFNGDVVFADAEDGAWSLTAILRARGSTADEATAALDKIEFAWSHESPEGHFLEVVAKKKADKGDLSADVEVRFPKAQVLALAAGTSNGDVDIQGTRTNGLSTATSNGDIVVDAEVTHFEAATSNGIVRGELRPVGDGRWNVGTSNGGIELHVPENANVGYELQAATSNGEVDYSLRDGQKGECPKGSEYYTPPCTARTFVSHRFDSRAVRVWGMLATSNGPVTVAPS